METSSIADRIWGLFRRLMCCAALLAAGMCTAAAGPAALPFDSYCTNAGEIIVSRDGRDYLRFSIAAWGPQWAYADVSGRTTSVDGVARADLTTRSKEGGLPLRIALNASRPEPRRISIDYELRAEADTAYAYVVVELNPGAEFDGRDLRFELKGRTITARCPLGRRAIGDDVAAVRLEDASGRVAVVRLKTSVAATTDRAVRLALLRGEIAANQTRRLSIDLELPGETTWYASVADVPDEPGISNWYQWRGTGHAKDSLLSMADWFDAPAGRHGRIVRRDDKLIYNGKPIKLWGLNLCYSACCPEKSLSERRAALYRRYGINAVRLHKFADGPGWAGIQSKESCVQFDPAALDRMDYQVAKLKEAGIYVKLSAHFGTLKLGPADRQHVPFMDELGPLKNNRVETPHSAVHYSPELQNVHILQITNLLKHRNPYTGLTYAEDPAIAFVEIINEQSILFFTSMAPLKASQTIRKYAAERFCTWLRAKYGSHDKLVEAWGRAAFDCFDDVKTAGEHLDRNNILPLGNPWFWDPAQLAGSQSAKRQRLLDTLHFLYTLQCEFYERYVKAVREAGYTGELVASNWQAGRALSHYANLHSDWLVGTIDRHNYFGGRRANASMLVRAGSGVLSSGMQQAIDRPFMLSEWIHVYPNEMGVEGPAIIGAYGMGLQGWDVSFMFQNGDDASFSQKIGRQPWDVTAPQILGIFPAVARQIHRGDVTESDTVAVRNVHVPSLFAGKIGFEDSVAQGYDDKELDSAKVPARALAVARSAVAFTPEYVETPAFDLRRYGKDGQLISSTGQLSWREGESGRGGFLTINSPGTRAVVGFAAGQTVRLGDITIEPQSRFGAIYVTAREPDKSIETSRQLLVFAIARARNTGMKFSPAGDRLLQPGSPPIIMEPVRARITLPGLAGAKAVLLDHDGVRTDKSAAMEGTTLIVDGARDATPYYLIERP